MAQPIARNLESTSCPTHGAGMVVRPTGNVTVNGRSVARLQGKCLCGMAEDRVITGAATVQVNGQCVARLGDVTIHGATVTQGSPNVVVGGPTTGGSVGDPAAGDTVCQSLAKTRASGKTQQTWSNCGEESVRLLLARARLRDGSQAPLPSEAEMAGYSVRRGTTGVDATPWQVATAEWEHHPNGRDAWLEEYTGGTSAASRKTLLSEHGVDAAVEDATVERVAERVSAGHGVITAHSSNELYGITGGGSHALNVVGVEYDAQGKPETFIVSDTGDGQCCSRIPAARFASSLKPKMTTTTEALWRPRAP